MQVRVALLQEYFRIRLFWLLQLMAYCLLENVSTDEKQNKMYVINTVNATCEIYMLAKCQQIDDWFSENWEVKNLFLHVVPCTKSYTLLWSWALVILPPKITTIFFWLFWKALVESWKEKKKIGNQTRANTCYIFNNQQMAPEHFSDPESAFSCISRYLKGATVSKLKVWFICTMIKIGSLNLPHKLRFF